MYHLRVQNEYIEEAAPRIFIYTRSKTRIQREITAHFVAWDSNCNPLLLFLPTPSRSTTTSAHCDTHVVRLSAGIISCDNELVLVAQVHHDGQYLAPIQALRLLVHESF